MLPCVAFPLRLPFRNRMDVKFRLHKRTASFRTAHHTWEAWLYPRSMNIADDASLRLKTIGLAQEPALQNQNSTEAKTRSLLKYQMPEC